MPEPLRVGFFGGSFDPPHVGHVLGVAYLIATAEIDRVLVVPAWEHPFAKQLAPFDHRVEMCRLAMGWLPGVEISRVEQELEGPSLTLRTLEHLGRAHPDWRLRLVVGADVLAEAGKWHAFAEVTRRAPLLELGRVGHERPDGPPPVLPGVSSTRVRDLLARRDDPPAWDEVRRFVPAAVLRHVEAHGLYSGR